MQNKFDRSEKCLLKILHSHEKLFTTNEILVETQNYPKLCSTCKSATAIITAANRLLRKGVIERSISKGGFLWTIIK